jgi:3-oxo-5-alpha-steroid 4-dehydrogenase 1
VATFTWGGALTPLHLTGDAAYDRTLIGGLLFALFTVIGSSLVKTPYGRFASTTWGPSLPIRQGWLVMEAPALPAFWGTLGVSPHLASPLAIAGGVIWTIHYLNRALYFPLTMRARPDGRMAVLVAGMGSAVATVHAWLYASWLGRLAPDVTWASLATPGFVLGAATWALGFALITSSEAILRNLRPPGDTRYHIPQGGGFRWVSSPHYLGEILAWLGLMVATGAPGGLFVLCVTLGNLVPRAAATHAWYKATFADYPASRRALLPFVW